MTAPAPIPNLDAPKYINQFSQEAFGIHLYERGQLSDAEGPVQVKMVEFSQGTAVFDRTAEHPSVGEYSTNLKTKESSTPGSFFIYWNFRQDGEDQEIKTLLVIGKYNHTLASLTPQFRHVAETVWIRFSDMFDSATGGPNLQMYYQSSFNLGRVADLMLVALGKLNTIAQPHQTYTLDGVGGSLFPLAKWGSLLEQATYIEVIRHLRRSYLEQPSWAGPDVTRLDRSSYFDRWGAVLNEEEAALKSQLDIFKIGSMNLGRPATLVSGGVWGRSYASYFPGIAAARGQWFWNRIG